MKGVIDDLQCCAMYVQGYHSGNFILLLFLVLGRSTFNSSNFLVYRQFECED